MFHARRSQHHGDALAIHTSRRKRLRKNALSTLDNCEGGMNRPWSPRDDEWLERMIAEGLPHAEIGEILGRTRNACNSRACAKGWRLSSEAVLANRAAGR